MTIGENSIVGAGAVVTHDVPPNTVAAGNPARVVREFDPEQTFVSRRDLYASPERYFHHMRDVERELLADNTLLGWLRYVVHPRRGD